MNGDAPQLATCPTCNGEGQVEGQRAEWVRTGELMRQDREARGKSLEEESKERGVLLWMLTMMEAGLVRPIPREVLL